MRIGVFDSGIGGLTVLRELRRRLPGHSTLYLGDTARVPYGTKSPQTIRRYAQANAEFLMREGIDYLVVACNTASAHGLEELSGLPIRVSGVIEPGAQAAVELSSTDRIGILGTPATVRSGAYTRAIHERRRGAKVDSIACPLFVPLVEEGWEGTSIARDAARLYLEPWICDPSARPDTVILGCTHYPMLKDMLQDVLGGDVRLIDSAEAVAKHVEREIAGSNTEARPAHRLFLTDASEGFVRLAGRFFPEAGQPQVELVDLEVVPH